MKRLINSQCFKKHTTVPMEGIFDCIYTHRKTDILSQMYSISTKKTSISWYKFTEIIGQHTWTKSFAKRPHPTYS